MSLVALNRRWLYVAVCWGLLVSSAIAQQSALLAQPYLNRYGLTRGWFAQAPISEQHRLVDVQYHTGEVFALTEGGFVVCYDANTGARRWAVQVGDPRRPYLPLGVGKRAVAVINGSELYAIGRVDYQVPINNLSAEEIRNQERTTNKAKGAKEKAPAVPMRTVPMVGKVIFHTKTEHVASAGPGVSDEAVFVPTLSSMMDHYTLDLDPRVRYTGSVQTDGIMYTPPVASDLGMTWISSRGTIGLCSPSGGKLHYTFRMRGMTHTGSSTRLNQLFAGTNQGELTMFNSQKGEPEWNTSVGVELLQAPIPIDKNVYVLTKNFRLFQLNIADGRENWKAANIRNFMAATPTKVYALDEAGRMVMLDPKTGAIINAMQMPHIDRIIANQYSDQMFFVSESGLIQEIHETSLLARLDYSKPPKPATKPTNKPKPVVPMDTDPASDPFATTGRTSQACGR